MHNKIDNRYRIIKALGRGGNGYVYLVYDEKLKQNWAMKELKGNQTQEIETLKTIDYPAFPRIVDFIQTDTSQYIIMDCIEGITLREYIRTHRTSEQTIQNLGLQIAQALLYLHSQNPPIYYLDCKPDNILISPDNRIHIIDFGSTYVDDNRDEYKRISGTALYAPQEQQNIHLNKYFISAQCDIYSFGITLFYAFTQTEHIIRDRKERLLVKNFNSTVSAGMNKIIDQCTRTNRKQRYHSMKEVVFALQNLNRITKSEKIKQILFHSLRFFQKAILSFVVLCFALNYVQAKKEKYLFFLGVSLCYLYLLFRERKQAVFEIKKDIIKGEGKKIFFLLMIILLQNQMTTLAQSREDKLNVLIKDNVNRNVLIKENYDWEVSEDIKLVLPYEQLPEGKNVLQLICTNKENSTQKSYYLVFHKDTGNK